MGAKTFTGDQFTLAIAVDIQPLQVMILTAVGIDRMASPNPFAGGIEIVFPPSEAITVTFAEDEFVFAITIEIDHENGHTGSATEIEIGMPDPFALVGILGGFQPSIGQHKITATVARDVAKSQAMALMVIFPAGEFQFVRGEFSRAFAIRVADEFIHHQRFARRVGHNLKITIAIHVPGAGRLDTAGFGDVVHRPVLICDPGVFAPAQGFAPPSTGDKVESTVTVDVHGDGGKIIIVFVVRGDAADLVLTLEIRAFIPIATAHDIRNAVTVDVEHAGGFVAFGREDRFSK